MNLTFVEDRFQKSIDAKQKTLARCGEAILECGLVIIECLRRGNKVMFCGNGGSAADAQHLAAELVVKLAIPRRPFPAIALSTDTSILTAAANDFSFEEIFARQVRALGQPGDILIGISTPGNSANVMRAVEATRELDMISIGLLGRDGGRLGRAVAHAVIVPEEDTQRIQECHILIGHIWMEMVEEVLGSG